MIELCSQENCTGCGACYNICPKSAISMLSDEEGFLFPQINSKICVECGRCLRVCPELNKISKHKEAEYPLAVVAKEESIRVKSSSGGMFSLLADWVLSKGGVVFGAAFNDEYTVYHCCIKHKSELDKLRGSKYAQSDTKETYREVKEYLKSGMAVLYTGTPCQIAGLYGYLGGIDVSLLYTVDLVCHGVPPVKAFKIYLRRLSDKLAIKKEEVKKFCFRELEGWGVTPSFQFAETRRRLTPEENLYMRLFLSSRLHRHSCYNCLYTTPQRISDITIADFWGIGQERAFGYDVSQGCSLVLLNTEKGKDMFEEIRPFVYVEQREWREALRTNTQLHTRSICPKDRDEAYHYLFNKDYTTTYNHFFNTPYIRFRHFVGNILRSLHLR